MLDEDHEEMLAAKELTPPAGHLVTNEVYICTHRYRTHEANFIQSI
jgi:hypothetical protein